MPINLLKLPRSVGVLVVAELEYREVFLLSLCSRRTTSLVKKAEIKVPKLAVHFKDSCGYKEFNILAVTDKGRLLVTSVLHVSRLESKKIFTVKLGNDQEAETNFEMFRLKRGQFIHRMKCAIEPMAVQKAVQDYINSIFHYSDSYQLILITEREGKLPNITNVNDIIIGLEILLELVISEESWIKVTKKKAFLGYVTVHPQFLTNVMMTYPDTQSVSVYSDIVGDIPNESPFFQIPHFFVAYGKKFSCGPDYIHNFYGKNLRLERASLTEQDLIQFLQKWISHEAYYNLETLSINTENALDQDLIRQAIEYEEFDPNEPEKRPYFLYFKIPYFIRPLTKYRLRDPKVVEIKRITDGRRGFLYINGKNINFVVQQN
ncbi:hypothetical protein B9Z55_016694 [Caenorhabditis nigoni]|uniref:F-box domain-containing protein n=1 Tax=Caenorhabditis nigoni TaxID=1611254 RepID=A0A2G5T5V2_9PELO|nr:hypothetical protein B9Z55_016694 [Caenorhabditis nigoni]